MYNVCELYMQHIALFNARYPFSFASHSAYTEAYNVCSMAVGPQVSAVGEDVGKTMGEEDQGRTSEEEEGGTENNYDKQVGFLKRTQRFWVFICITANFHTKMLNIFSIIYLALSWVTPRSLFTLN